MADEKLKNFAVELFQIKAIKFEEIKTKIGINTPIYCDLRLIVSYPKLLETLADLFIEKFATAIDKVDILCGVPYTALPIATVMSVKNGIPMVMRRKEAKSYGTKKMIEGKFRQGDGCLIVEDVVTSGSSILETVGDLTAAGTKCTEALVLIDRQQGGKDILKANGIKLHALFTLPQLLGYLEEAGCIDRDQVETVETYLASNQIDCNVVENKPINRLKMTFKTRAGLAKNAMAQDLFALMEEKQSNLCVAADLTSATDVLNLAEQVGAHICLLKTHIDIIEDFHPNFLKALRSIAEDKNFILFEDRKFADIGKTVELQYTKHVSDNFPIITAHSLLGKGVLDAIKQSRGLDKRGVFLLAETSAAASLIDEQYTLNTLKLARENSDLICGIVCQSARFLDEPGFVQLTPGVRLDATGNNLSQQYNDPSTVVLERGADVAVVGRGITQAQNPAAQAAKYQELLWNAYSTRMQQ